MNREMLPDSRGYFGAYGGRFVPEVLIPALDELEAAFGKARNDPAFQSQFESLSRHYSGRPTPLYFAERLTAQCGGAQILLKREDLAHTGAHKINNALGQALLADRMGKKRIIAETGAGQHGVAVAAVCAMMGMKCIVYMGEEDMHRQSLNVFRMRLMGAELSPVSVGSRSHQGLGNQRQGHLLPSRFGGRPAPVSAHGPPLPVGHREGGPAASPRRLWPATRLRGRLRRRRQQRHRDVPSFRR